MKHRSHFAVVAVSGAALGLALALTGGGCGTDNAVVGGNCAAGYTDCDNQCVDLETDPENCGACGHVCPPASACVSGICGGSLDATLDGVADVSAETSTPDGTPDVASDATPADAPRSDAPMTDAPETDGPTLDGSTTDGSLADGAANDGATSDGSTTDAEPTDAGQPDVVCTPPFDTPSACGDCTTQCVAPNGVCAPTDGGFACAPMCPPPDIQCNTVCVDPTSDPFNCNGCGNFCPTFICESSKCVGSTSGELVLIGHDYFTSIPSDTPQAKVLTNSVFVRAVPTTRVLAYERYANPTNVANVDALLAAGGSVAITHTSNDGDIPAELTVASFEVLLVHDQPSAPAGALGPLGASWQSTLTTYLQSGGVVVVLDGATAPEMPLFVTDASLLGLSAQMQLANTTEVVNQAPGDIVGNGVASPYRVTAHSSRFTTDPPSATITYVIFDQADDEPVVVHKTY